MDGKDFVGIRTKQRNCRSVEIVSVPCLEQCFGVFRTVGGNMDPTHIDSEHIDSGHADQLDLLRMITVFYQKVASCSTHSSTAIVQVCDVSELLV